MSVESFNGHVILPHAPDWTAGVEWSRVWHCGIVDGVDGTEERMALRTHPRHALRFRLVPYNLQERAKLLARLRQAAKSGLVAVPFWGRGLALANAQAQSSTVALAAPPAWTFLAGDPVFFGSLDADAFDAWEVRTIVNAAGATLTLDEPLQRSWPAGWFCWPVLLGHATHGDIEVATDWHVGLQLDFEQLAAPPDPPQFENICFDDLPGSCETFSYYPAGMNFIGANPEVLTLTPGLTVPCWLSLWLGADALHYSVASDLEALSEGALPASTPAGGVWLSCPPDPGEPWRSDLYGVGLLDSYGGVDDFAQLPVGTLNLPAASGGRPLWCSTTAFLTDYF
jgi:hypothetical protein